jgi:hypothetical protein
MPRAIQTFRGSQEGVMDVDKLYLVHIEENCYPIIT